MLDAHGNATFYHLAIELDESLTTVQGRAAIRFTNQENVELDEVALHLYPNILGGKIEVSALTVDGVAVSADLVEAGAALQVPLTAPLAPGGRVVMAMDFAVTVPTGLERNFGVFSAVDGTLALAHFYPMVAVFDDEGWNTAPPPPNSDVTYADASYYLVQVGAPATLVLAGAGREIAAETIGARQTITYAAGPARDFYLAASTAFTRLSARAGAVTINSYAPAASAEAAGTALDVAAAALTYFGASYGPYPYTELDLVAIPTLALGIEYPGLIALNRDLFAPNANFGGASPAVLLESTVAHEVGHQWFYNLVGNDQLDEPWLDEALTQYATWRYYGDRHGPGGEAGFAQALDARWQRVDYANIPIGLPASAYTGVEYGAIVYGRGPFFFGALAERLGDAFDPFLRDYAETFQWQIATGTDLKQLAEQHCGCDLTELFVEWGALP